MNPTRPVPEGTTSTPRASYRKLSSNEVLEIANRLKHADDINFAAIRAGVKELFGEAAHKTLLIWGSEYDDETYSHRPSDIKVWDAAGKRLRRPAAEDDYDEPLSDFFRELDFGSFIDDCESLGEMTILLNETGDLAIPDLYIKD